MQQKRRILIVISFSFSIRYIIRSGLLNYVQRFAIPVVILTWHQQDLIEELQKNNIEVYVLEPVKTDVNYQNLRRKINFWFSHFRSNYSSKKIQENFLSIYLKSTADLYKTQLNKFYNVLKFYIPYYKSYIFKKEEESLKTSESFLTITQWVISLNAHAVFTVTPFHSREDIFLRACKQVGLKMTTSILSFDNITKRGWMPITYDLYMVWNQYNLQELHHIYPETKTKQVQIVGAPQFDFYNKQEWLLSINDWKKCVGIDINNNKKIILYAGGPQVLFPEEPMYLKHINDAINNNEIKDKPLILFRCHPVDNIQRWIDEVGTSENIIFDTAWTGKEKLQLANITDSDIKKLCSTLQYTDVHINLCSTMTLDGSAFDKPQIGPAYLTNKHASRLLLQMYFQKHFKPIVINKGIELTNSREELINKINNALQTPSKYTMNCKQVLTEIITYTDNNATERVAKSLFNFLLKVND